ncbi:MAG: S9 family peptidase, partial [Acidimicrobiales bacterium]
MPINSLKTAAPQAEKRPITITQLGRSRTDNYAWIKDDNWQEVMKDPSKLDRAIKNHLVAENAYTQKVMAHTKALQDKVFAEMKGRIKDDDSTVPAPDGPYLYSERYRPGDQHGLYVRRKKNEKGEEILLDADHLAAEAKAAGDKFFDIASVAHSDDHILLAYAVDTKGSERFVIHVKEIASGKVIAEIPDTAGDFVWVKDGHTLFWVERDDNNRPCYVYRQDIDDKSSKPTLVYTEKDPGFFVGVDRSDTGKFITIGANDHTTSETWLIASAKPDEAATCVSPRLTNREYDVSDQGDDLFILTNAEGATDFKIVKTAQSNPGAANWEDLVPHRPGTLILGIETYENYLVRLERKNALPQIVIHEIKSGEEHTISFDEQAYGLGLMGGYEFDTPRLRFSYSSPTTPQQVYDYHMGTRKRVLRKTAEIPSGHDPANYRTERISITARDGETIPVTLIMRSDFNLNTDAPCLLYGYGSYGITIPAGFRTSLLSLVDRGFVYAIAHIRGGKSKGYEWYTKGKLATKHKTFDDFVDVGRGLCDFGYTQKQNIIAYGGSAGGLLVGAALNQAPDLFGGVIGAVPFVDVLNTMSDDSLPLTPPEWPEWGNPLKDETAYDTIAAYSPYDNVVDAHYPPVLITAG